MKSRIWLTIMLVTFALGPISAQKKAPAAKKAAPAAAIPAQAPPEVVAPPAKAPTEPQPVAAKPDSALQLSTLLWGGYNIASSDIFSSAAASTGLTKGGLAGGIEILGGISLVRGGIAVTYLPVSKIEPQGASGKVSKTFLPIEGVLNIYLMGFYLGGRGGYLLDIGSTSNSGQSYTATPGTIFGGQVGYQYSFGPLSVDVGVIYSFAHAEATGVHADYNNLVPRIGLQYIF